MRRKTTWLAAVVFLFFIGQLCGCTPSPESLPSPLPTVFPTPESSPTPQRIEALDPTGCEIHLWHSLTGEKEATLLHLASDFEQNNPYGIRLRVEFHSPLHREVLTAIAAGTPPDIVMARCEQIMEYASAGAVVPLDDYIHNPQYGLSKLDRTDLWPVVLKGGCLPANAEHPLGLLFDSQLVVLFYNAQWLEQLEANAPPRTWEAFRELCNAARDKEAGTWGYAAAVDGSTLVNWILGLGGLLVDPDTGLALLDSAEAIAALSVLKDVLEDGCAYCASDPSTARADLSSQKVLFYFGTTAELPEFVAAIAGFDEGSFNWNVAPVPYLTDKPLVSVHGLTVSVLRTTPRQQLAAWLFPKWLVQPKADVQWALATGALPMLKSSKYAPEMEAYFEQNPQYKTACDLWAYAQPEPALRRWCDISILLAEAAAAVCQEYTDPAEALAAADVAADDLLSR